MKSFNRISTLEDYVFQMEAGLEREVYLSILKENHDEIDLLNLLEKTNPSEQKYHLFKDVIFITFKQKKSYYSLGKLNLSICITFVGFPLSISKKGYLIKENHNYANLAQIIKDFTKTQNGTIVVLNSDIDIHKGYLTESTFSFYSHFSHFEEYVNATRSNYHKKIRQSLEKGKDLIFEEISPDEFNDEHYDLYLSVHNRVDQKLITMPISYFKECKALLIEIRDDQQLLAFIQLKEISGVLYFILGGFRKDEEGYTHKPTISHIDLYYNMLLYIIKYGIEHDYKKIVLGQTAAESKSKLGAKEELSYIYINSSNPLFRLFFSLFPKVYSFESYGVVHKVFKEVY